MEVLWKGRLSYASLGVLLKMRGEGGKRDKAKKSAFRTEMDLLNFQSPDLFRHCLSSPLHFGYLLNTVYISTAGGNKQVGVQDRTRDIPSKINAKQCPSKSLSLKVTILPAPVNEALRFSSTLDC